MMRNCKLSAGLLCLVALALAGAARAADPASVAEAVIANKNDGLGILLEAVQAADPAILETLSDTKLAATVFAPTDYAFAHLLEVLGVTKEELLANTELLNKVLLYHVVPTPVYSGDLEIRQVVNTLLEGDEGRLKITKKLNDHHEEEVRLYTTSGGGAKVITADVEVGHSVIHIINRVLVPGSEDTPW